MLRTVHLHGRLGERFGRQHRLDVASPAEAIRALSYQLKGFGDHVREGRYAVTVGAGSYPELCVPLNEESVELCLGGQSDIHIAPEGVVAGVETIILVAVLALVVVASVAMVLMMKAPRPQDREEATRVGSHMFDGPENTIEQGHPVPLVYGELRVGSIVASSGITTADVAGVAEQGGVSAGPGGVPGAGDGGGELDADPTPQQGTVGTTPQYPGTVSPQPIGDIVAINLVGGGGKGGGSAGSTDPATEDPNTLQSAATARVLEVLCEGEIVGLVNGLKSVFFDNTQVQNNDGTYNFQGVAVEQRVGLATQDVIQGFTAAENPIDVSTQVKISTGAVTRTVTNDDATRARVTIRIPALMQTDTETGDIHGSEVSVKISVSTGGGYTDVFTMTINGKTNTAYERSVEIPLPVGATRNVRVTRLTADSIVTSLQNDTYWSVLTEIVEAKLTYPDTALIGLTVDARQFGTNIPARSYHIRGRIIEVPVNYNPTTRAYTGVWNGAFKKAWTNNPAWILRDLIVNRRFGLGARVPASSVDKWGLYAIAQYCDGLLPDGKGGNKPRFTINCSITNAVQAYDLLASIASTFRGMVYWSSGAVFCGQDRPEDPTILINPSSVVDGHFSYARVTPHDRRRSVGIVWWNDPEDGYKLAPAVHEDPDLIRKFGRRAGQEVTGLGITDEMQAIRAARWLLEDERPSSNLAVQYAVGDDHSFVEPGKIAMVADPMFTTSRRGGRVVSALANSVTMDQPYTFTPGLTHTLRVMLPDGTVRVRPITNGSGTTSAVATLSGAAFSANPNPGAVWTIETDTVANRQFRVRQIETDEPPYRVRALLHDTTKYARVELDQDLAPSVYSNLPTGPLAVPYDLGVSEYLETEGTATIPCGIFGWTPGADARVKTFQAEYKKSSATVWTKMLTSSENYRIVRNIKPGSYDFRVRGVADGGKYTPWQQGAGVMDGKADLMPEVVAPGVVVNEDLFSVKVTWFEPPNEPRPLRYEILYHAAGTFASAVSLGTTDRLEYTITESGTYWVRTSFMTYKSAAPVAIPVSPLIFSAGIVPHLTNDAFVLPASSTGVVSSYAGATGSVVVMSGSVDISTSFALSTAPGGNAQNLTVNYVGQTYTVTGGLDAAEATGTLVIRLTGSGTYAGVVLNKVFTLAKAQTGLTGDYRDVKFQRANLKPATPTGNSPAGWFDGVPAGTATLWMTVATKTYLGVLIGTWSVPEAITGLTPRGAFSATETYYTNNTVTYNGGTYVAVQNAFSGQYPSGTAQATAYWDVIAAPGAPGEPGTPPSAFSATINLTSGAAVNLRTVADANGYTGLSDATITFNVPNGVTIRGASGGGIGLDSGTWPTGYTIALTVVVQSGGIVDGGGGSGGAGGGAAPGAASVGGDAIYLRQNITGGITINSGGIVRGGGGGGGGAARVSIDTGPPGEPMWERYGGGGGGGGFPNGAGGAGGGGITGNGAAGAAGTTAGGGLGGNGAYGTNDGGNGGNAAVAGQTADASGGAAGYAVRKNGKTATVTNNGTMTGTSG